MTLRVRLAIWFGLVVALGVGAASVLAYVNTAAELRAETDDFLRNRAREFTDGVRAVPPTGGNGGRDGRGRNNGSTGDNDELDQQDIAEIIVGSDPDSVIQSLDREGNIRTSGPLPVDEIDLRLAGFDDVPVIRDITSDGVDYRMITQHMPGEGAVQVARATAETEAVLSRLGSSFAVIGLAVSALAAILGWVIAARATRPLRHLSSVAENIAETQDLTTPLPTGGRDEVGRLAQSLDQMIDALATSRDQQQRLVMDASHELRTPLTSLRANVELLGRAPDLDAATRGEVVDGITSEVEELSDLVTELVELATDSHNDEPFERVDLLEVANGAIRRLERRSERDIVVSGTSSVVMGHHALLDRAIGNLLANAHKFSPGDERIDIEVGAGAVSVRDHGPGIPEVDLPNVFDRFYRSAATRTMPGSGLGLAIVAQIVDRHGGEVHARNDDGGGAVVGFRLPLVAD